MNVDLTEILNYIQINTPNVLITMILFISYNTQFNFFGKSLIITMVTCVGNQVSPREPEMSFII